MTVNTEVDVEQDAEDGVEMPTVTAAYAGVLSAYAEVNDRVNSATRERKRLRKLVDTIPAGAFGDWQKVLTDGGQYPDMDKIEELLAKHGETMPMKAGNPVLTVTPVQAATGKK